MAITEKQIIEDVKAGKIAPVYLLTGEENYYIDELSDFFEKKFIAEEFQDFDRMVLYGKDVDMQSVVSYARRFPIMSPYQLVLVKEAQDIDARTWPLLAEYLKQPQPTTALVFCYRHKKLDKRTAVYKAIDKAGVVFEKKPLYDNQVPGWIANLVRQRGYSITEKAATIVAESIGNDLGKIVNEMSKVFISLPEGSVINEDIIEQQIGISKDYNIFELQNAIGRRDVVACNKIINHFAANPKEYPIQMVLPTLYGFFIKVMLFHQNSLTVNPFFAKEYEVAARNYSLGKLASCIGYLHETDLRSKGVHNNGTITDGELMKELVFKIIH